MPFRYDQYRSPFTDTIAARIANQGAIEAQRAQSVGNAYAGMVQNIGGAVAQIPGQMAAAKRQQLVDADMAAQVAERQAIAGQRQAAVNDQHSLDQAYSPAAALGPGGQGPMPEGAPAPTRDQILAAVPGHLRESVQKTFAEADQLATRSRESKMKAQEDARNYMGFLGVQVRANNYDPATAMLALQHAAENHQDDPQVLQQLEQMRQAFTNDPSSIQRVTDAAIQTSSYAKSLEQKTREVRTRNADGSEAVQIVKDEPGQTFNSAPPVEKPREYEVEVPGPNGPVKKLVTADTLRGGVPTYQKPDKPDAAVTDVKDAVAGMKAGTLPPQLPGRASKEYVAIMAEAKRQGFDLAGAATDWQATQKHIATLNGAQQLRLNQAINSLPEMLDSVDALAAKWKGGKFPILNKANLALAKGGAYGSDVASVANQLDAQIADVTADLGNVYMGGNSPTDHALGLASKSLSGEWDEKVLHDMTRLARQNVQIRQNSIRNTGVAGASEGNPYAPPQNLPAGGNASAGGMIEAFDPQGNVHHAPAGTPLPAGWKLK